MLLFYSDSCPHSKMLLETIKRHNGHFIKLVSIDMLRATGKTMPLIHSVPALVTLPDKRILFGKQVFDYLLLPKTGKLVQGQSTQNNQTNTTTPDKTNSNPVQQNQTLGEPASTISSAGFLDNFAPINENGDMNTTGDSFENHAVGWGSTLNPEDMQKLTPEIGDISVETRPRKQEINLDDLRSRRALDLERNDLNITQLAPPEGSRDFNNR